jgi:hypothetical protein
MLESMPHTPVSTQNFRRSRNPDHEHSWMTESSHRVSRGFILYVRCSQCTARRVDFQTPAQPVPSGISRTV